PRIVARADREVGLAVVSLFVPESGRSSGDVLFQVRDALFQRGVAGNGGSLPRRRRRGRGPQQRSDQCGDGQKAEQLPEHGFHGIRLLKQSTLEGVSSYKDRAEGERPMTRATGQNESMLASSGVSLRAWIGHGAAARDRRPRASRTRGRWTPRRLRDDLWISPPRRRVNGSQRCHIPPTWPRDRNAFVDWRAAAPKSASQTL